MNVNAMSKLNCPNCKSENIIYSQNKHIHVCTDCREEIENSSKRMNIFLRYGHDGNAALVEHIRADLEGRGHDVWIDREVIKFGDDWRRVITNGIMGNIKAMYDICECFMDLKVCK